MNRIVDRKSKPPPPPPPEGWVECAGAFIPSDLVQFGERVWRNGKKITERVLIAQVLEIEDVPEEWVHLEIVGSDGDHALQLGSVVRRKRSTVERNGVIRRLWGDESARTALLDGKP